MRVAGGFGLLVLLPALVLASGVSEATSISFSPAAPSPLPASVGAANDVRWRAADNLILAVSGVGVVEGRWNGGVFTTGLTLAPQGPPPGIAIASKLGLSEQFLAVAAGMSEMLWQSNRQPAVQGRLGSWWPPTAAVSFFDDVDLRGDELAVRGLIASKAERTMSPDGAIAWRGRVGSDVTALTPIAYSLLGRGARTYEACTFFDHSHIRFLADGRIALALGAEPGVQIYGTDGRLIRAYDTSHLGVSLTCDFAEEQVNRYFADELAREEQLSKVATIDEIIPTAQGLLVLVKPTSAAGTSHWRAYLLRDDGSIRDLDFPWQSDWKFTRVSGDQRDGRIILLFTDNNPGHPPKGGRLVETRLLVESDTPPPAKH